MGGNAVGLLHAELRRCGSLILRAADAHKVPAGSALAVDREGFAQAVTAALSQHPLITIDRAEVAGLPPADWDSVIIATGPLTSPALAEAVRGLTGEDSLAFFDAIAPIVHRDTIDMTRAWFQSRYDKAGPGGGGADYINCALDRDQYEGFIDALLAAEKTVLQGMGGEHPLFRGVPAHRSHGRARARDAALWADEAGRAHQPHSGARPYAVVQLRQDNALGTLYNMVGFQTKLKHGEQKRVFQAIPGLEQAEFARLGGLHRNTFINSPRLLDGMLRLKAQPRLRFAGQITGVEGYVESAAIGLLAGTFAAAERRGLLPIAPPATTALGALQSRDRRSRCQLLPADELQFRTVPAARRRWHAA